jgi:hypothetical protein
VRCESVPCSAVVPTRTHATPTSQNQAHAQGATYSAARAARFSRPPPRAAQRRRLAKAGGMPLDACWSRARPFWPVTTTFGTACSERYTPILPALMRVFVNMIRRELARPSVSSRQTVLSFASTSASRFPDVYGANLSARCAGRRCSCGETSRVV